MEEGPGDRAASASVRVRSGSVCGHLTELMYTMLSSGEEIVATCL